MERELELARTQLGSLQEKEDELTTLREHVDRLKKSSSLSRVDAEHFALKTIAMDDQVAVLTAAVAQLRVEVVDLQAEKQKIEQGKEQQIQALSATLATAQSTSSSAGKELSAAQERFKELEARTKLQATQSAELAKADKAKRKETEVSLKVARKELLLLKAAAEARDVSEAKTSAGAEEQTSQIKSQHLEEIAALRKQMATDAVSHEAKLKQLNQDSASAHAKELKALAKAHKLEHKALTASHLAAIEQHVQQSVLSNATITTATERVEAVVLERDALEAANVALLGKISTLESLNLAQLQELIPLQQHSTICDTATTTLTDKIILLETKVATKNTTIVELNAKLEEFRKADSTRSTYIAQQNSSASTLKSQLAELRARSSGSSTSTATVDSSRALRSSTSRRSSDNDVPEVSLELQAKNEELSTRVASLERKLKRSESSRTLAATALENNPNVVEQARISRVMQEQEALLEESRRKEGEWKSVSVKSVLLLLFLLTAD